MALDATFGASDPLTGNAPEQTLALVAVRRRGGRPQHEVVRRRRRDRIDERLQRLLVHVHFLCGADRETRTVKIPKKKIDCIIHKMIRDPTEYRMHFLNNLG